MSKGSKIGRDKDKCKRYKERGRREKNKQNQERKREEHKIGTRQKTDKPSKYLGDKHVG